MKRMITFMSLVAMFCLAVCSPRQSSAQFTQGSIGMSASIAVPSGIIASAAIPGSSLNNIAVTLGATVNVLYVASEQLQGEIGLGYLSISTETGNTTTDLSTLSFSLAGKYFLKTGPVMPYVGAGFSFSSLPTIEGQGSKTTASLLMIHGFFGGQAFINKDRTIAVFIQIGIGYNSLSSTTSYDNSNDFKTSTNTINLGGSAAGICVYM